MIEFLDNDPILTHSHSLTVTYPRRISITYGNYPFIEDIHNLIIEIKNNISEKESYASNVKEGKNKSGGLNAKGVASYRRANPGSKLKTAVTTKPSKLKKGSKAAKRRKSFCARMEGMKKRRTSEKTARDPNSRINKSLRKWNC